MRAAALAILAFVSGCAFTSETVRLEPPIAGKPIAGAERVEVQLVVQDLRRDASEVVARKINGMGIRMAAISSETPIAEVIARTATLALQTFGYRVADSANVKLVVELISFNHEFRTGFWVGKSEAQVIAQFIVRSPTNQELYRKVLTEDFSHDIQLATGPNVKKAYEGALSALFEVLFSVEAFRAALATGAAVPAL